MKLKRLQCYSFFLLGIFLFIMASCGTDDQQSQKKKEIEEVDVDWSQIKDRGTLKAITYYGSTSYFLYRGQPMGYEYELVSRMAEDMGLDLEIVIADNLDKEIEMLKKGQGDIIIHGLTITQDRKEQVAFTIPHTKTHQVLVQKKPDNWRQMKIHEIREEIISDPVELIGKKVYVRKNSSYYKRLQNLEEELGGDIDIVEMSGDLSTEDLIRKVAEGEIPYTVADYNIAAINNTFYQNLDIDVRLSFSQRIAWAVRKNSPTLLKEVNEWIAKMKQNTDYYVIYNKYFNNSKSYRRRVRSDFFSLETGRISRYDDIIKARADSINWDWRLLSSMIYQESGFNPRTKSWAGARGLMQLMPATAKELGVSNLYSPESSIEAGTKYISYLSKQWTSIPDSAGRVKFVLASYNVGLNHVKDAQRLAEKNDEDPNDWEVIRDYLLKLSSPEYYNDPVVQYGYCRGEEPYYYVKEILERYEHYKRFVG
ncbi:MAG: transporter substrate-binding domain-containing protein [Bacteroidales bacterium]|nr:transporter substrate-binding domain-containing protein [Bacteroidales bacterium]